jgi:hypothetical protein
VGLIFRLRLKPESVDPGAKVRSVKVTLTQMLDLMLTVLLVSMCKEKSVDASQAFYRPFSFQVIKLLGRTRQEAGGECSPCLPARASQVSGER